MGQYKFQTCIFLQSTACSSMTCNFVKWNFTDYLSAWLGATTSRCGDGCRKYIITIIILYDSTVHTIPHFIIIMSMLSTSLFFYLSDTIGVIYIILYIVIQKTIRIMTERSTAHHLFFFSSSIQLYTLLHISYDHGGAIIPGV